MHQAVEPHDDRAPGPVPVQLTHSRNPYGVPHEDVLQGVVGAIMAENDALRRAGMDDIVGRECLRLNRAALMDLSNAITKIRLGAAIVALKCQDAEAALGAPPCVVHCWPETGVDFGGQDTRSRGEPRVPRRDRPFPGDDRRL